MAKEYGWKYEKLVGDQTLIKALLTTRRTTDEILVVPPKHVIEFDALHSTLAANPIWSPRVSRPAEAEVTVMEKSSAGAPETAYLKIGLGIDAGGTYTDTVI